jgi:hypothetical protein
LTVPFLKDITLSFLESHKGKIHMGRQLTKAAFGAPSPDALAAIDSEAKVAAMRQACFEYEVKRRDLEQKFEVALSQLREAYLAEVLSIQTGAA